MSWPACEGHPHARGPPGSNPTRLPGGSCERTCHSLALLVWYPLAPVTGEEVGHLELVQSPGRISESFGTCHLCCSRKVQGYRQGADVVRSVGHEEASRPASCHCHSPQLYQMPTLTVLGMHLAFQARTSCVIFLWQISDMRQWYVIGKLWRGIRALMRGAWISLIQPAAAMS